MKIKEIIGIDVSKLSLDVRLHLAECSSRFDNTTDGIAQLVQWSIAHSGCKKQELFFVFEHTGLYSYQLAKTLIHLGLGYTIESGLAVKRSLGITRGKDAPIDAIKLALYGYRLRDELSPYQLPDKAIEQLQCLLTLRGRLVKQRSGYKACLKEQKRVLTPGEYQVLFQVQEQLIGQLSVHIKKVEAQIKAIIRADEQLKFLYQLITLVKGVGPQTAYHFIVFTHGFTRFTSWSAFAAYAGTAPFPHRSGSSIRGKNKVSHLANKKMKSLLDMCAKSAIQHDRQLKGYYQEKVTKGKPKMSVINAVRNKIMARVFAVVKRKSPFVDTYKFAA
ncbi:MAG: IS110 family transposase [Bacteroidota bacterium]